MDYADLSLTIYHFTAHCFFIFKSSHLQIFKSHNLRNHCFHNHPFVLSFSQLSIPFLHLQPILQFIHLQLIQKIKSKVKKLSLLIGCFGFMLLKAEQPKEAFSNEQLSVTYTYSNCHDNQNGIRQEKVLLSFQNKTNQTITVSFDRNLWYNDVALNTSGNEKRFTVELKPNQQIAGECATKDKAFVIFSKQLDIKGRQLTKFALDNISIK